MEQSEQYGCIWFAGNQVELLAGIRQHLALHHRKEAVRDLDRFIWNKIEFVIQRNEMLITVSADGVEDTAAWNSELQAFYEQVVRPVADKTGGVAVGLAEPGAMNRQIKTGSGL